MIDQGVIFCGDDFVTDGDGDRDVGVGIGEGFKDVRVGIQDLDARKILMMIIWVSMKWATWESDRRLLATIP